MAESKSFHCSVVTPDRVVIECEAKFVALPAHDGEVGVLAQRAPLLTRLGAGQLRIEVVGREDTSVFIDGGFAEMASNRLTILTESAIGMDEFSRETAEALLAESRQVEGHDEAAYTARQHAARKARAQLRLLK